MLFTTESVDFYSLKAYGPTSVCGHLATMCNSCHSNLALIVPRVLCIFTIGFESEICRHDLRNVP
jgi:hypothetical protein